MPEKMHEYAVLGSLISPSSNSEIGSVRLSRAELSEGVGVFGSGYETGTMVLVEGANLLGFEVLVIDSFGKFWSLLNASANSKMYLLGDYVLNPLKPESNDKEAYSDLLCEALFHSFGIRPQTLSDLKGIILETLDRSEGELTLMDLASLFEAQSEISSQLTAYGVLQPLLTGRSATAFEGRQTIYMADALKDITVVELSNIQSRSFKILAYTILMAKILDYARENECRILLVIDTPEIVWPDTSLQRLDSRASFFHLHIPQMLGKAGVYLCLCSMSPMWIEKRILSNIGTLIHFRAPNPYGAKAASSLMGGKIDPDHVRTLRTSFSYILRAGSQEPELCRFRRPRWLFSRVSKEDLITRNSQLGIPPAMQRLSKRCKITEDFLENAEAAYKILERIQASGGLPYQQYSSEIGPENKRLVSKLLRLQYLKMINSDIDGIRQSIFALTKKGVRAEKEFEKEKGGEKER